MSLLEIIVQDMPGIARIVLLSQVDDQCGAVHGFNNREAKVAGVAHHTDFPHPIIHPRQLEQALFRMDLFHPFLASHQHPVSKVIEIMGHVKGVIQYPDTNLAFPCGRDCIGRYVYALACATLVPFAVERKHHQVPGVTHLHPAHTVRRRVMR